MVRRLSSFHVATASAWLGIFLVLAVSASTGLAYQDSGIADPEDSVSRWIHQLDAPSFQKREAAQTRLVKLGEQALRPLGLALTDCPPETQWRIRKTLEQIAVEGNEEVLYRSAAILRLRFDSLGSTLFRSRIREMEILWREQQRSEAISSLRRQGVRVVDPLESGVRSRQPAVLVGPLQMQQPFPRLQLNPGFEPVVLPQAQAVPPEATSPKSKAPSVALSAAEYESQVLAILDNELDANRELVHAELSVPAVPAPWPPVNNFVQIQLGNNAVVQHFAQPRPVSNFQVTLDRQWKGKPEDLEPIKRLDVSDVCFSGIELTEELLKFFEEMTLDTLTIENCECPKENLTLPKSIGQLIIDQPGVPETLIQGVPMPGVRALLIRNCELSQKVFERLRTWRALVSLKLQRVTLESASFDQLSQIATLSNLELIRCRFQTVDYRELQRRKPNLKLQFTPTAFLGVQANQFAEDECEIDRVIDDSAAADAGVRVGDVIVGVGEDAVEKFDDLKLVIAGYGVGDEVQIHVQRDGQRLTLKTRLRENNNDITF